jgi:hypothetical protein
MTQPLQYGVASQHVYARYYSHSGKVTAMGIVVAFLVGVPAAIVAGLFYAYADLYSPIVYLNVALTLFFGVGMGALCGAVLRWGKVRNVPVSLAIIGMMAAVAYYVCWVAWVCGTLDRFDVPRDFTMVELTLRPDWLIDIVRLINEDGTWSIGRASSSSSSSNKNVSGVFLWIVWAGEAAMIFGGAFIMGRKFAGDLPFCENCDGWCGKADTLKSMRSGDESRVKAELSADDYTHLREQVGQEFLNEWWQIDVHRCPKCKDFNTVSLQAIERTYDNKGNERLKKRVLVNKLIYTGARLAALKDALAFPTGGPTAAMAQGLSHADSALADVSAEQPLPPHWPPTR